MEEICHEIMVIHKKGKYLMYQKAQQIRKKNTQTIKTFGIEDNQGKKSLIINKPLGYGKAIYTRFI